MANTFQDNIAAIEADIQAVISEHEATKERLEAELLAADQLRDQKVSELQQKRNDIIYKEKLKQFPAKLVNNHKTCSVCGADMKPYSFMENDKIVKAWACQAGGFQDGHDLIRLEQ